MITGERIKTILYQVVKTDPVLKLIPEIVKDVHAPVDIAGERIVINLPGGTSNDQFQRAIVGVSVYVPDVERVYDGGKKYWAPDNVRIETLENVCMGLFGSSKYGTYQPNEEAEKEHYLYKLDDLILENDEATKSHFLNVRILFEVANFKL